jgi:hypothetical protein
VRLLGWCLAGQKLLTEILPSLRSGHSSRSRRLWIEHPKYVPVRERLIAYLRSERYRFRRLKPVVFLCGGANSVRRDALRDYLRRHRSDVAPFYAERVWERIASRDGHGALKMESDLAALADLVVIVVESPGTFAELGAFSLAEPLRRKLLPIVDIEYKGSGSFVVTGPLRWIDHESDFRPTIYTPLKYILESVDEIEERIDRIPKSRTTRIADLTVSPKHLLFFLCDLIGVIHPATVSTVEYYFKRIASDVPDAVVDVSMLVALGIAMDLLRSRHLVIDGVGADYISPNTPHAIEKPYHHTRFLDLPSKRADHLSVLLLVPESKRVLEVFGGGT